MENIQEYGIEIDIGNENKLYQKISKLEKRLTKMQERVYKGATRGSRFSASGGGFLGNQTQTQINKQINQNVQAAKIQAARIKQAVGNITKKSDTGKASKTAFADMLREEGKANKVPVADAHVKALRKAQEDQIKFNAFQKESIRNYMISNAEIRKLSNLEKEELSTKLKQATTSKELLYLQRKHKAGILDSVRLEKQRSREMKKQTFLQERMTSSAKQMAGNMVSAFAVAGTIGGTVRVGQEFEGIESALLAVSDTAKDAKDNLKFVRDEALRLGKPLKDSSRSFSRMLAAKGNLSQDQIKELFSSTQEMATVLGLNADENNRAMVAIGQMLSKGKITAEELKNQLAESGMANAIPEMVKAAQDIGLISKEMNLVEATSQFYKLQEQGKVISEEILPAFGKRLREVA